MDLTYEAKYHQLEEEHWWFASRCDVSGPVSSVQEAGATGDLHHFAGPVNTLLLQWVKFENRLLRHLNLPLGVSVFALAQKPA